VPTKSRFRQIGRLVTLENSAGIRPDKQIRPVHRSKSNPLISELGQNENQRFSGLRQLPPATDMPLDDIRCGSAMPVVDLCER
jgi:hypothetical protein